MSKEQPKNEQIFPGGPTQNKVEEWKAKFGEIFMSEFGEDTYIFRTISRLEYKQILNTEGNATELYREEQIVGQSVLWPENLNHTIIAEGKAGIPTVLTDQVMNKSGFVATSGPVKL